MGSKAETFFFALTLLGLTYLSAIYWRSRTSQHIVWFHLCKLMFVLGVPCLLYDVTGQAKWCDDASRTWSYLLYCVMYLLSFCRYWKIDNNQGYLQITRKKIQDSQNCHDWPRRCSSRCCDYPQIRRSRGWLINWSAIRSPCSGFGGRHIQDKVSPRIN